MTVLVCMTPESGGWVMRRWEKPRAWGNDDGHLRQTHVGGLEGMMHSWDVRGFMEDPPLGTRLQDGERA